MKARPAEFSTEEDSPLVILEFRREKLPPAMGEKATRRIVGGKGPDGNNGENRIR